ncbi:hypothetical protein BDW71DRAFT_94494 [Aspergillus fruticulosus]
MSLVAHRHCIPLIAILILIAVVLLTVIVTAVILIGLFRSCANSGSLIERPLHLEDVYGGKGKARGSLDPMHTSAYVQVCSRFCVSSRLDPLAYSLPDELVILGQPSVNMSPRRPSP